MEKIKSGFFEINERFYLFFMILGLESHDKEK